MTDRFASFVGDLPVERGLGHDRARLPGRDDDDDLAPGRLARRVFGGKLVERAAPHLLMQLGQFARHRRRPGAKLEGEVGERLGEPPRRLVENERAGDGGKRVDALPPRGLPGGQESLESEAVGGQAGDAKGRERRRRSRRDRDGEALRDRLRHKPIAGIGNERRPGVGDQRQRLALGDALERPRTGLGGVVLVVGRERPLDAIAREQRARNAGVLGQNPVGPGQDRQSPERHVHEVADRRRHDIEARTERRGRQGRIADHEASGREGWLDAAGAGSFRRGHFRFLSAGPLAFLDRSTT